MVYTKQDFLAKSFSLPTLSMIEYFLGYLPFISYSTRIEYVCINPNVVNRTQSNCNRSIDFDWVR